MPEVVENLPVVSVEQVGAIVESVIVRGDLQKLTPEQRTTYYNSVCKSMGLNPLTRPLEFITLNGKLTLYALKNATDQLRKLYGVSVVDMTEARESDLIVVTVKVRDEKGRTDISKGALTLKDLKGEALANAIMKAETKAKRRATLSICGLGFLDETEVEAMPSDVRRYTKTKGEAKELYSALQAEVHELTSAISAQAWLDQNANRLALLPADWEDFLRTACQDIIRSEPTEVWGEDAPADDTPPEHRGDKWDALGPVKQAGVLCNEYDFCTFLTEKFPLNIQMNAAEFVREYCGVQSRKELATAPEAAKRWRSLVADYRMWQHDDVSPRQPEPRAAQTEAGPATHTQTRAGSAEVLSEPESDQIAQADKLLEDAAMHGSEALKTTWALLPKDLQRVLKSALDRRHKPAALACDHHR